METNKTSKQKIQKQNQLVFIEYEKPSDNGHFMTVMDSYRNVIGRINKNYNEQTKKYEYTAFDHAGKSFSKGEKLWEVKGEFISNRKELLENAHQRRIASKENSKDEAVEKTQKAEKVDKTVERKNEIKKVRGKSGQEKQNEKAGSRLSQQEEREQELQDLRDDANDARGELEMGR